MVHRLKHVPERADFALLTDDTTAIPHSQYVQSPLNLQQEHRWLFLRLFWRTLLDNTAPHPYTIELKGTPHWGIAASLGNP
jgi:hypothetical protein